MIDLIKLLLIAGDGGDGKVSFRREKFVAKGGPDGGDGGDGGAIIVRARAGMTTLRDYAGVKMIRAGRGGNGGRKKMFGQKGADQLIEVPVGTVLYLLGSNQSFKKKQQNSLLLGSALAGGKYYLEKENQSIPARDADEQTENLSQAEKQEIVALTQDGQELVLCRGGKGGRGNVHFKSSRQTTPLEAEYGGFGEQCLVQLELKLLADVGLVGLPNAGKSTFLSKVTKANPKIANYPFTTLEPNLGIMHLGEGQAKEDIVIADIPGLIEGASEGKGLGLDFLRHIENCQSLMFVLFLDESTIFDGGISDEQKAKLLWQQYEQLRTELASYGKNLLHKRHIVTINKIDLYTNDQLSIFRSLFLQKDTNVIFFSTVTGEGINEVQTTLAKCLQGSLT